MLSNLGLLDDDLQKTDEAVDARLTMSYKTNYGLVATPFPSYFEQLKVYTRHMQPLS